MSELLTIAIDGPASSGKSTIAQRVAECLEIAYADTGAMYRAITYLLIKNNLLLDDEAAIQALLDRVQLSFVRQGNQQALKINDQVVSEELRSNEVTSLVSKVAALSVVREKLTHLQQEMAKQQSIVMDGRDIGTQVLPNASFKLFFVADVDVRAQRRYKENQAANRKQSYEDLRQEIIDRDHYDMHREISPLKKASDAIEIDTSYLSIEEVVQEVLKVVHPI